MTLEGVDTSVWQASPNWKLVAAAKAFGISRAVYGTSQDITFKANWIAMKAVGIPRGAYAYLLPAIDGRLQARSFLNIVGEDPGELPLTIDVETTQGLSNQKVADDVQAWIEEIRTDLPDRRVFLYGSPGFLNALPLGVLAPGIEAGDILLWTAHYNVAKPMACRWWPAGWTIWQYGTAPCPGFTNPVDVDRFVGTLDDLNGLALRGGDKILIPGADDTHLHVDSTGPAGRLTPG